MKKTTSSRLALLPRNAPSKKTPNLWLSMMSCSAVLLVLCALMTELLAYSGEGGHGDGGSSGTSFTIVDVDDGTPNLVASPDGDSRKKFLLAPDVKVTLNGSPATLTELKSGDSIEVKTDEKGRIVELNAARRSSGIIIDMSDSKVVTTSDYTDRREFTVSGSTKVKVNGQDTGVSGLEKGDLARIVADDSDRVLSIDVTRRGMLMEFWENFRHNLFKPLLLFFYMGFSVPLLKIAFEFPHVIYQGLTIYLLVSIGWHGGEELAELSGGVLRQALMFMGVGFLTNFVIGIAAYVAMRAFIPKMRRIDAATVSAYYGSDSAGTFVTCLGVLATAGIKYAAYMPVMLAIMEIPGCLVGLFLVSRLRQQGMDALGNMQDEPGYDPNAAAPESAGNGHGEHGGSGQNGGGHGNDHAESHGGGHGSIFSAELLREVFLNPGLFLLFGGIVVGFVSRLQGHKVTDADDSLFVTLFQGMLCLFLLEMGMTASRKLMDLKTAGWRFIVFGLVAPNVFAITGICVAHVFSMVTHEPLQLGSYALFSVLCGAASYIAVPAIQRLAIPEASPTLPLAASLGLTFSYNVTVGIPVYIVVAQQIIKAFPVAAS